MGADEDLEMLRATRQAASDHVTKEPERWKAGMEELGNFMRTLGGMVNLVAAFAAPRYLARGNSDKRPMREQLLGLFDDYLALLDGWKRMDGSGADHDCLGTEGATLRLRALVETWEWSLKAPEPIVEVARQWLAAYGQIPEPADGWDQWAGPEDEDVKPGP